MVSSKLVSGALLFGAVSAQVYPGLSNLNHTCVLDTPALSCPPQSPLSYDPCCTETFGGLVLFTQFWSTYTGLEAQGQKLPKDTWTLHGMWPDFCNGSYTQYCDLTRQYDPVPSPNVTNFPSNGTVVPAWTGANMTSFIEPFGRYDLLDYMNHYWVNQGASNDAFWAHEFSKHATCFSTFNTPCYGPQYVEHQEIIEFFDTAIMYYKRHPTWEFLSNSGILPSNTTQVSLSDLQTSLVNATGALPYIGCSGPRYNTTAAGAGSNDTGRTVVSEVWYYNYVLGRPQDGMATAVNATGSVTSCAKTSGALWYYEPTNSSLF